LASDKTISNVYRAKAGDREAWEWLCRRYYDRWLIRFHGQLGDGLRNVYDTGDIVQSAITEALRDVKDLRSEAAFYVWVSAIIRKKIADKRRRNRLQPIPLEKAPEPGGVDGPLEVPLDTAADFHRLLDLILSMFSIYPEHMAAVYLKYFERLEDGALMKHFEKSQRSVHRILQNALALLRSKMVER
jgi:RNA polymerase sigma factor (sigma-70 family)